MAGEVRIQLVSASICHTDIWVWSGADMGMMAPFPMILGHEGAGVVEAVGEGVEHIGIGDKVVPCGLPHCGDCVMCKHDRGHGCVHFSRSDSLASSKPRYWVGEKVVHPLMSLGTFSEYIVVPSWQVAKVRDSTPLDKISPVGCAVLTGWGAAEVVGRVQEGSTVVVYGVGAVGLCTIMACKNVGAKKIIAVDLNQHKLELAKECGATDTLLADKTTTLVVQKITHGGADFAFECTGVEHVLAQAVDSVHPGWGEAILVGCPPITAKMNVPALPFILRGLTMKGSLMGGWKNSLTAIPKLVEGYLDHGVPDIDRLVTRDIGLDSINQAFSDMQGEACDELRIRINY
eukprot:TRINITY_DN60279_c0_g1_i1.p1 TRINITY_DN60279_c0_g1~~TRINITY_DN60279_c0_g1_i1.p1  ORF type:complete len:397 (-),score=85.32 TRINITY_DN60279_c0_g1_i1:444-1481(-)